MRGSAPECRDDHRPRTSDRRHRARRDGPPVWRRLDGGRRASIGARPVLSDIGTYAMTYHRLETNEGDRFYREAGAGETVVLLHCSSGSSGPWLPAMDHLSRDYRGLAPDLVG